MNRTSIETTDGAEARETELIRAFAYGGLVHKEAAPPAPPMPTGDPTLDAAAMDRWQRQTAEANSTARKIRVDTGAKAACPT